MAVGGTCAVEGCKRPHMYNSPVCYKHKDIAEEIWWAENDENSERREPSIYAPLLYVVFPFLGNPFHLIWGIILSVFIMWITNQ